MPNIFSAPCIQKTLFGFVVWCCLFLLPNAAQSATSNSATLQWAANSESDLAGYRVYQGTTAGVYGLSTDVGKVTTYTISNLQSGLTNYFAITAYDMNGNESLPSQEVSKNISDSSGTSLLTDGLNDDFNDGNFSDWQVVNEGTWDAPSAWTVVGGVLQQTSNIYDGNTDGTVLPKKGTFAWYTNGLGWSNYKVAVQMRSTDDDALGIMVRYQNPTNYYRFSWDAQRLYRRLVKVVNGAVTLLRQDAVPYVMGQSYQVEVVANGNTLEVRVDGVSLFGGPVVDSALSTGSVALYSWGNIGSVFDNVHVGPVDVPPTLTVDFNDGNFSDWQVVNEGTWDAPSAWTVVGGVLQQTSNIYDGNTDGTVLPKKGTFAWYTNGLGWSNYKVAVQMRSTDDDALGIMVRYQNPTNYYRFSWDAQRLYRRLVKVVNGAVTLLRQDAVPYVMGQSYQVEVVANGNTLEVRVDGVSLFGGPVVDSALSTGSVALYSWGNIGSVFDNVHVGPVDVPPTLTVDFNDGNFSDWQVVNEGTWDAPSAWTVVGGVLQQTSNIYDGNTDGTVLPKKGTFAWYTNGLGWSNYKVAVQMRSTDDDALGIMVRYQNPTNYYRFSWDAQRLYRRLVKVVNGAVTLLRQDAVPYVMGQSYQVEVVANGNTLEVRVDGVSLFGGPVVDSALSTGSVALYSWGNIGSVFDNVHVGPVDVPPTVPTLPTLTVTRTGTGGGTVTSSPAGITCAPSCVANFASGTSVTLTATPDGASKFDGWSGDADCSDGHVTMTEPLSCMPTFTASLIQDVTPPSIFLTSPTNGSALSGTVNINATATDNIGVVGVQFQLNGTNLGTEDQSTPFSISWNTTGVVSGQYTLTAIARDAVGNFTTSAPFKVNISSPTSSLSVSIAGSGSVTSNPNGILCTNGTCSASYGSGSTISLVAKADKKWTFSGWSGACSGTGECVVQLSTNQFVKATFSQNGNGRGNK